MKVLVFSLVQLFKTLWTVPHQAPLSMGFSSQEYSSGLACAPLGVVLRQESIPHLSSAVQVVSLPAEPSEKPIIEYNDHQNQDIKVASMLQILWCLLIIIPCSPKPLGTLWSVYSLSYFFPTCHINGIRYSEYSSCHLA